MPQVYEVQYQINVNNGPALEAIKQFQQATTQLELLTRRFDAVARSIGKLNSAFKSISVKPINVQVNTATAEANLKRVLTLIGRVQARSKTSLSAPNMNNLVSSMQNVQKLTNSINRNVIKPKANTQAAINSLDALLKKIEQVKANSKLTITASAAGSAAAAGSGKTAPIVAPVQSQRLRSIRQAFSWNSSAHEYLGNVYAGSGANIVGEMVKGMGIAYGISSIFSGVSRIFKDAIDYDNISTTTRNILSTHDTHANFQGRFNDMNALMRQVGVETKFTAPQVASAGKFLAMAGLNIEQISQAIRPISDIALIGDTDLGETADVTTNIMTAYQIPAEKMNRVADIMTSTFTSANVTLLDMAESFQYSASLFKKAGVPFEVATASLGILGNAGMKGSQAGTTMRTILANIYKPTKGQQKAWDAIGVSRTDKDGNIRDLPDIFADLHEKGLDVKTAYSIFHKTAAQGAVALADAVEEWNKIISNNFLSESLAKKLANEKKNTIQGLWYQITSAFTESGMQGFESLQTEVTDFLKSILKTIQSPQFAKSLKTIMSLIVDMTKMLTNHITVIAKAITEILNFPIIGWLTKSSIKLQMWVGTFAAGLKMIISTKKAIQSLTMLKIVGMTARWVTLLGQALFYLKTANALNFKSIIAAMRVPNIVASGKLAAFQRLQSIRNVAPNFARTAASGAVQAGAAGAGASVVTSGAAGWGGLLAPALPYLGVAAAIAGIAAIGYAWYSTRKEAVEYMQSIRVIDGISMSEHATQTDKYLRIVYDKQSSVNQKLQEYIKLRREELGLASSGIDEKNTQTFEEQFPELWDKFHFSNWRKATLGLGAANAAVTAEKLAQDAAKMLPESSPYRPSIQSEFVGDSGLLQMKYLGHTYYNNSVNDMNRMNAATLLFSQGANTAEGSEVQSIVGEFNERFLKVTNKKEWNQVYAALLDRIEQIKSRMDMSLDNITMAQLGHLTESQWKNAPAYIQGVIGQVMAQLNYQNLDTANSNMLANARGLILKYAAGMIPTPQEIQTMLQSMGIEAFNPANGLVYGNNATWWNQWGYAPKNGFQGTNNMEPDAAKQNVLGIYTHAQQQIGKFDPKVQGLFGPLLGLPQWGKAGAGLSVSENRKFNYVTEKFEDDTPKTHTWTPTTGGKNNPNKSLHNGTDQSQYKSHYDQSSAPKQVIVRIENLMRVDKQTIDMTDSRQVAAINNIKQELATALLDVVQDFNANIV